MVSETERTHVEWSIGALSRYPMPFITDFTHRTPKPEDPDEQLGFPLHWPKAQQLDTLKRVALGETVRPPGRAKDFHLAPSRLIRYLDFLQESGRQDVYLFRFPDDHRDELLRRLRDRDEARRLIGASDEAYSEHGRVVWCARRRPELAHVRLEQDRIVLKWIETRDYSQTIDETQPAEEEPLDETEALLPLPDEERAATFLFIDLTSGECQLRIHAIRGTALARKRQLLATYTGILRRLFGCELAGPAVLAPAIRQVLLVQDVPITYCEAILPSGGRWIGHQDERPPVDVRKLEAGVVIRFEWKQERYGLGRVELHGRLDAIGILRPLRPDRHRELLDSVKRWRHMIFTPVTSVVAVPGVPATAAVAPENTILKAMTGVLGMTKKIATDVRHIRVQFDLAHAAREYLGTHAPDGIMTPAIERHFLDYMNETTQMLKQGYESECEFLRKQEQWHFRLRVAGTILLLLVLAAGSVMMFVSPNTVPIGLLTAVVALIATYGTVANHKEMTSLREVRLKVQISYAESQRTGLRIESALAQPKAPERGAAVKDIVTTLLQRAAEVAVEELAGAVKRT